MSLGRLLKDIAPVLIGATFGPGIGTALAGTGASPLVSRAITGALTSKIMGGKNKDALRNAFITGLTGAAFDSFGGGQPVGQGGEGTIVRKGVPTGGRGSGEFLRTGQSSSGSAIVPTEQASQKIAETFKPRTFSAELLKSSGVGGDNLLARLLNTPLGEGLTAGLLAQLLSGDDKDEDTRTSFERRPFGSGGPGGRLGGITFAKEGGEMGFPRRNGGIDPSEGSGTKDDVPAMLMAGEFVLTKDAVKGLGDGNQRKGIQRAYNMMDNLEARA